MDYYNKEISNKLKNVWVEKNIKIISYMKCYRAYKTKLLLIGFYRKDKLYITQKLIEFVNVRSKLPFTTNVI